MKQQQFCNLYKDNISLHEYILFNQLFINYKVRHAMGPLYQSCAFILKNLVRTINTVTLYLFLYIYMYSYTYKYTQVQLFLIGRVSLFEEMDDWEFSNKILKLKEKMKKEQDEEEDIADTDFGKYFTQNTLIIIQEDVVSQYFVQDIIHQ